MSTARFPALLMARRNLSRTRLRSALAALGIVIGVVAIASLGILGATFQRSATEGLGDIGNQLVISPGEDAPDGITDRSLREIERSAGTAAVVPYDSDFEAASFGRTEQRVSVYRMARPGRLYTTVEGRVPDPLRSGAVVGTGLAEEFGIEPGNTVVVNGSSYRVRAIVEGGTAFSPANPSSAIILPSGRAGGPYDQVVVQAASGRAANASAMAIRERLNDRRERVSVLELADITDQINQVFGLLNTFLLGVGSISLVVAGVSILNVMLMSTVERREEIGVLRAVGFQRRDVLTVMLAEAALLGAFGGFVGTVLSVGVGALVANFMLGDPLFVLAPSNLWYLLLAFGFGVGTAVLSGLYPAWKAANEHPVEALRS